jgi:hypothetical protein
MTSFLRRDRILLYRERATPIARLDRFDTRMTRHRSGALPAKTGRFRRAMVHAEEEAKTWPASAFEG